MKSKSSNRTSFLEFLKEREFVVHLAFWTLYLFFPYIKSITSGYSYVLLNELINLIFGLIVFYVTYFLVLPSNRKIVNVLLLVILFSILGYINLKMHNAILKGRHEEPYLYYGLGYFSTYTMLSLFSYVLYSVKKEFQNQRALEQVRIQKQQAELSSLKAQINPHFLFNTLNMIYGSALKKDDKTPDMILKLSDNFRYLLQKGQSDSVTIDEDISHIKDYIGLQEERLTDKISVNIYTEIDNTGQIIPPLLFLPFIENAFKYGSLTKKNREPIDIRVTLRDNKLSFKCTNPFNDGSKNHMDFEWQESGIGIRNTRQRLDFFYENRYKLDIRNQNNIFKVELEIQV